MADLEWEVRSDKKRLNDHSSLQAEVSTRTEARVGVAYHGEPENINLPHSEMLFGSIGQFLLPEEEKRDARTLTKSTTSSAMSFTV
jgi:hypothetical protein